LFLSRLFNCKLLILWSAKAVLLIRNDCLDFMSRRLRWTICYLLISDLEYIADKLFVK
jgi:hypothetical protein